MKSRATPSPVRRSATRSGANVTRVPSTPTRWPASLTPESQAVRTLKSSRPQRARKVNG